VYSRFCLCTLDFIIPNALKILLSTFHSDSIGFKGRVHCFSKQIVMNKCFLNPEKNWRISVLSFSRKTQKAPTLIPKHVVTEPKTRLL